jgi:hypothetical protein
MQEFLRRHVNEKLKIVIQQKQEIALVARSYGEYILKYVDMK